MSNIARMKEVLAKPIDGLTEEDRAFLVARQGWLADDERVRYAEVLVGKPAPAVIEDSPSVKMRVAAEKKKRGGK